MTGARSRRPRGLWAPAVLVVAMLAVPSLASARSTCRGAAARDPQRPCFNPTRSVTPGLAAAAREQGSPCVATTMKPEPICRFGAPAAKATDHIALIGDSHALHWRGALDIVARAKRWEAFSVTSPGCLFSVTVKAMFEGAREPCEEWFEGARRWLKAHREIHTVFVSQNSDTPIVVQPGESMIDVKAAGYGQTWRTLPAHVKRVVVIRDTPTSSKQTVDCVKRVISAGVQRPGAACPFARSVAIRKDAAAAAVLREHSKRFRTVDLTRFFCSPTLCYPVIGGTLVFRDISSHMTLEYARSLGPYLLRKVRRALAAG